MTTRDLTVVRFGTDSSGRPLFMTRWMNAVLQGIKRHPDVAPFAYKIVPVQGAFMSRAGGGASASEGVHNAAGCLDIRTWNLTTRELDILVRVFRMFGFALWRRDYTYRHGGMAPHGHATLGSDGPLSSGAAVSWSSYLNHGDGLAGPGSDYEWRPDPLVTYPPDHLMEEDYLMTDAADRKLDRIIDLVRDTNADLAAFRTAEYDRDKKALEREKQAAKKAKDSKAALVKAIGGVLDAIHEVENKTKDAATKGQLSAVKLQLLQALKNDPDVDGPEKPE